MSSQNNSTIIKREILIRLVRAFFSQKFERNTRLIPFDMRPKGSEVPYRCCIYKERAILKDRVIASLGFSIEDDDETISLEEYAKMSLERKNVEENPLTVLGAACKGCVPKRIHVTDLCQGCVARPCNSACKFGAISIINGKSVIDSEKCQNCKMCISACPYNAIVKVAVPCEDNCPVDAIHKNEDGTAKIDFSKCIFCGKCVSKCPFGAVHEKSQLIDVLKSIREGNELAVMFAPAIVSQFPGSIGQLKSAIKKIGFKYVYEVAQGADITTKNEATEFDERLQDGLPFMTTSCCAGYNEFVEKHLPEINTFKSTTKTPMFYTAEIVKKEHPKVQTVFISPCVAKKQEAKSNQNVDFVLNAEELGALFIGMGIEILDCEETISDVTPSKQGRNFPVSGGVAQAVQHCSFYDVFPVIVNGLNKNEIKQLKKYTKAPDSCEGNLIEVMCCEGGCISGNATISDYKTSKNILDNLLAQSKDIQ